MSLDNEDQGLEEQGKVKQPVFSTKSTKEIIEKANKLKDDSGLPTMKEWFEMAVAVTELHQMQGTEAERAQDTQQVKFHLNRALELFLNQVQKLMDLRSSYEEQLASENIRHKQLTDNLQDQKTSAESELERLIIEKEALAKHYQEVEERSRALEKENKLSNNTIEIIQRRNNELEAQVLQTIELEKNLETMKEEKENQIRENGLAQTKINELEHRLELAEQKRIQAEEAGERKVSQIENVMVLKLEKAVIESDRRVLEETTKLTQEHDKRERQQQQIIEELTAKVHDLEKQILTSQVERNMGQ